MSTGWIPYLIVCPLVLVSGYVDSIAGGGGLISIPAFLLAGLPPHLALGTSKLAAGIGTGASVFQYSRSGFVSLSETAWCAVSAIIGAVLGSKAALLIPESVFRILLLVLLPLTALYAFSRKSLKERAERYSKRKTRVLMVPIGFIIGVYDGLYGPGCGTFLLLLLTGVARMPITCANGTAKIVNMVMDLSSLTVFLFHGKALIPMGILCGCFSIAGNYLGAKAFIHKGTKIVRPIMIGVLAVFLVRTVFEMLSGGG